MPISTVENVDTTYFGFKIWTGDSEKPWAEALAVKDGIIVAVGKTSFSISISLSP